MSVLNAAIDAAGLRNIAAAIGTATLATAFAPPAQATPPPEPPAAPATPAPAAPAEPEFVLKLVDEHGTVGQLRAAQVTYGADSAHVIRLEGPIDDAKAQTIRTRLFEIARKDPAQEIILEINSGGGSVPAGWNIIDAMNSVPNKVTTICQRAESMAAIMLVTNIAGDRYAYPHCRIMLHEPSWQVEGTASAMAQRAQDVLDTRTLFAENMSRATGMPANQAMEFIVSGDTVLSAEQAYGLNFVDGILPAPQKAERAPRAPSLTADFCTGERMRMRICQSPGAAVSSIGRAGPTVATGTAQTPAPTLQ